MAEVCLASPAAPQVRDRIAAEVAVAPDLIDAEVFAVLALRGRRGELTSDQVSAAVEVLLAAPIERVPSGRMLRRAQSLTGALSGYDALYAALAQSLDWLLLTCDARFADAATAQLRLSVLHIPVG